MGVGLWTLDSGFWIPIKDCGLWTLALGFGLRMLDFGLCILGFGIDTLASSAGFGTLSSGLLWTYILSALDCEF